ncbi:MAG TPA: GNAT family N-acetyltransferase [Micrococcaceae bacterium]|nr:GNAT family N-acetyltransferase [Micrococcaceae bacterium]
MSIRFTFRPLARPDFPLIRRWLAEPHVARWWNHETTDEAVERDFGSAVDGTEPGRDWLALTCGEPIGLVQCCFWSDYPDYAQELAALLTVPASALTIDYLIGPLERTGRGLGTAMIAEFIEHIWNTEPAASAIIVPVVAVNRASWRTLEKCGFHRVAAGNMTPDNPVDDPLHVVYRLDRRQSDGCPSSRPLGL